jgi:hypothetical protein
MGPIAAEGCDIYLLRVVIFYYIKKRRWDGAKKLVDMKNLLM